MMLFIFNFDIVQWLVKWCSQAGSKRKDALFFANKTLGNEINPFLAIASSQRRKRLGGPG